MILHVNAGGAFNYFCSEFVTQSQIKNSFMINCSNSIQFLDCSLITCESLLIS